MNSNSKGMTLIVKTVTRLTVGLILIYGIYIVFQGHIGPGGGFAGGVIIALSFIHLMLAFGKEAVLKKIDQEKYFLFASLGALALLMTLSFGFMRRHQPVSSSGDFGLFSGGLIPLSDIASAVMMASGLFVIFLALTLRTKREKK
ncbi:MAG: MnhB domain-containing protein [Candidatus Omnitrophica bacterium]|nr:MnhB domain-containing protein [Candidatus Omnitrophota bacterium]